MPDTMPPDSRCGWLYDLQRIGSEVGTASLTTLHVSPSAEQRQEHALADELVKVMTRACDLAFELALLAAKRGEEVVDPEKLKAAAPRRDANRLLAARLTAQSDQRLARIVDGRPPR